MVFTIISHIIIGTKLLLMKTLGLIFIYVILLLATNSATAQLAGDTLDASRLKDGYALYRGAMIQIQNNQVTPLSQDVTLKNNTKVYRTGMVALPGKKQQKLAEGYAVNMNGKIVSLQYDMMRYDAIQEHSQKTLGNTDAEIIVTDNGIILTETPEKRANTEEMLQRRQAIIRERNTLIQKKADLLNKAKDNKAQQKSPQIKEVDTQLDQLNQELQSLDEKMRNQQ